ncbi:MAG: PqqD family protein [Pseudomonadota bacterium]
MSDHKTFAVASDDIVFEEFDGEYVVLNLKSGQYFGLNAEASILWEAIVSGVTMDVLTKSIKVSNCIEPFLKTALDNGLLAETEIAVPQSNEAIIEKLAAIQSTPILSPYDDLSDLIVADPIHDVEPEAGWPVLPADRKV